MIGSSAWLLPAVFFPIATQYVVSDVPGQGQSLVYGLWYLGHVVGMTWWA
jgi:hypothetical protein